MVPFFVNSLFTDLFYLETSGSIWSSLKLVCSTLGILFTQKSLKGWWLSFTRSKRPSFSSLLSTVEAVRLPRTISGRRRGRLAAVNGNVDGWSVCAWVPMSTNGSVGGVPSGWEDGACSALGRLIILPFPCKTKRRLINGHKVVQQSSCSCIDYAAKFCGVFDW